MSKYQDIAVTVRSFMHDDSGATAIEYGLIAPIMGVSLIAAFKGLRDETSTTLTGVGTGVKGASS